MYKNILNKILQYLGCLIITCIVSFVFFALLFHTKLFSNVQVLMYRGIIFIVISAVFNIILSIIIKRMLFKELNGFDIFSIVVFYMSVTMVFFILVPVTVERSVSVYMLSYADESDTNFTKSDIENSFIDIYLKDFGAFDKRFDEQIETGTIEKVNDNEYRLNDRGRVIVRLFRLIATVFNTDKKLVNPITYSRGG